MTPLNFTWLDDFLTLAESGNFSRAAQVRHVTQPAFSRRIRALEAWLGVTLFDRNSQPAQLTPTGQWFRGVAQALLSRTIQLPSEALAYEMAQSGMLQIASTHALSFKFLPTWLRSLELHRAPGPIQLMSDVMPRCESLLLAGQVQFLLTHTRVEPDGVLDAQGFPSMVIGQDCLLPVSTADPSGLPVHAISHAKNHKPLQLLAYSAESGIGRIVARMQQNCASEVPTQTVFTTYLASVLRTMALDGRGMAWLPNSVISDDLAQGTLVLAAPEPWHIPVQVRLYRSKTPLNGAGELFWSANAALPVEQN